MIRKQYRILTTAALLLAAVVVFGQNKGGKINLSLVPSFSTQSYKEGSKTHFNLGFISSQDNIRGIGINVLGASTVKELKGIQMSGLYNMIGQQKGASVAGLLQLTKEDSYGISLAGLANIVGESQHGLLISGLFNMTGNDVSGISISSLFNLNGDNHNGVVLGGVFNFIGAANNGLALAGLFNKVATNNGLAIAGLANLSANTNGVQLAPFNKTKSLKGLQVGLLNYRTDSKGGFQLGLINLNSMTKYQVMAYFGNRSKVNLAIRFKNRHFYNIVGASAMPYLKYNDKFAASVLYRTGTYFSLGKFDIGADIGYQHINTFRSGSKESKLSRRMYALEGRVNLEYNIYSKVGIIGSAGYGVMKSYKYSSTYKKGVIGELGLFYTL